MNQIRQDLSFTLRQMRRSPSFFLLAVLTVGLGIGSATAVFSVLDATFLQPLPYANQQRLVSLRTISQTGYQQPESYPEYVDMRHELQAFSAVSAIDYTSANLWTATGAYPVHVVQGSDSFFDVLGTRPLLGRGYLPGEETPGRNNVAVLSYTTWQRYFDGRADVIGSTARLNGEAYTVVGVMPKNFRYPLTEVETVYTPLHVQESMLNHRGNHEFRLIAAMQPGVDPAQAQADAARVMAALGKAYPDTDGGRTVQVRLMAKAVNGTVEQPLTLLSAAIGALLLIACVNVAGLLFARGVWREHEMALRAAVGASRQRLLRQSITETLLIALLGSTLGIGIAALLIAVMRGFLLKSLARGYDIGINGHALLVALALAVLTTVAAGLLPALRLARVSPQTALRSGTAGAGSSRGQQRVRSGLLVTQVALSLVLLATSGLLLQELRRTMQLDLGFPPDQIVAMRISLGQGDYTQRDPVADFYTPLLQRVARLPGTPKAGLVNLLPVAMYGFNSNIHIVGQPPAPETEERLAELRFVSDGYFDTMGSRLLNGRALSPSLDPAGTQRFVVNREFAHRFLNDASPVGAVIDQGISDRLVVVGEYTDMRQTILEPQLAEMDLLTDSLPIKERRDLLLHLYLVLRAPTGTDPMTYVQPLRSLVHALDAGAAVDDAMTMREQMEEALTFQRMLSDLFSGFAVCAVALTLVGIYGTIRHEAALRTRDIGLRMALGASRLTILGGILRRAATLAASGLALGLLLTAGAQKSLASLIEIKPHHEPALFLLVSAGMFLVCGIAALPPARRAASLDPMAALRTE